MDEFTLIYDNIVMALEMEQIDKVNVSTKANNIEKKKERKKCYSNTTNGIEKKKLKEEVYPSMGGKAFGKRFLVK